MARHEVELIAALRRIVALGDLAVAQRIRHRQGRVARMVGLSERRLQELMRENVGRSVHAYLSDARLVRASDLLRSGMSVTQVAGDLGYSSLSHFSKIFKARYGASPRAW